VTEQEKAEICCKKRCGECCRIRCRDLSEAQFDPEFLKWFKEVYKVKLPKYGTIHGFVCPMRDWKTNLCRIYNNRPRWRHAAFEKLIEERNLPDDCPYSEKEGDK